MFMGVICGETFFVKIVSPYPFKKTFTELSSKHIACVIISYRNFYFE